MIYKITQIEEGIIEINDSIKLNFKNVNKSAKISIEFEQANLTEKEAQGLANEFLNELIEQTKNNFKTVGEIGELLND